MRISSPLYSGIHFQISPFSLNTFSDSKIHNQIVAFAGIVQSARLIHTFASQSELTEIDQQCFLANIGAIFYANAENAFEVFPDAQYNQLSLLITQQLLTKPQSLPKNITRYIHAIIRLQKKIHKNPTTIQAIRDELTHMTKLESSPVLDSATISRLAHIYMSHCSAKSGYSPIIIHGLAKFLQKDDTQDKIRATILSGIRCAMLWRQMGGSILQFFMHGKKYFHAINDLIIK